MSRQGKWYIRNLSLLLHLPVVAMGYTLQDVEDAAAALLLDHPQALTVGPVAVENNILAREATQLASCSPRRPRARRHRRCASKRASGRRSSSRATRRSQRSRGEGGEVQLTSDEGERKGEPGC